MNGEIPSVPITTLAGVCSLTDLLTELPLPTPLPHTMNNKSLLYHPKVAEDARRLLTNPDDQLVSQLVKSLKRTSSEHIELKDSMASDTIEGEVPDLLRAILAKDPSVFKGGQLPPPYSEHAGNRQMMGGCQPYPPHPQQPSPYQAGQISPCPPGSPARLPPQPGSSPYVGQTSAYPPVGGYQQQHQPSAAQASSSSSSSFHQQFLNFAASNEGPTVNGGVSGSPSSHGALTPPHGQPSRSGRHSKPATVSSPAQAAPPPHDLAGHGALSHYSRHDGNHTQEVRSARRKSSSKSTEPVVLLEPLDGVIFKKKGNVDSASMVAPPVGSSRNHRRYDHVIHPIQSVQIQHSTGTVTQDYQDKNFVTRLEMLPGDINKYKIPSSFSKSKHDDRHKGSKRHYDDGYGDGDRKRRRRVNYIEDDSDDDYRPRGDDDDFVEPRSRVSAADLNRQRKRDKHKHKRITDDNLSTDELMETATFKKFYSIIDSILENADLDLGALNADDDEQVGLGGSDSAITMNQLENLCNEAAKLKSMSVTNQVPTERLVKILAILQLSIKDGCKALPFSHGDEEQDEALMREITLERVTMAVDAAMVALYIMTSKNMPKEVFIEDVIERLVMMAKVQLQNTIYPEFDPVYRVDPNKGYQNFKSKRARASAAKHREALNLYNKLTELVALIAELVGIQELTDTIILQLSTLAVTPFFVENISELQLNALKLVTCVFSRYEKHRQLIMEDILSSLARLPSSKKNLRSYRLNADENIQMVTALALELIQCVVRLPAPPEEEHPGEKEDDRKHQIKKEDLVDKEVVIMTSYETSMRTAHNFLSVFLKKCSTKGDEDYRPLFENFVYDLLATVNKPEWPAAELLLSLLGRLLVAQFSNKSVEMSLRIASLDYLGIVAARLRKDAVTSRLSESTINEIIEQIDEDEEVAPAARKTRHSESADENKEPEVDKSQTLQKRLLEYLEYHIQNDPALVFARQFYVAQWYRDANAEVERLTKKSKAHRSNMDDETLAEEMEDAKRAMDKAESRKAALFQHISERRITAFSSYKPSPSKLDYGNSCLVARYLASMRPFSQSFDIYLTQILKVLSENATAVRTKAMKCLTAVVEADPGILARTDMQKGVHGRFLDQATSVREAAVELVGKFILIQPELTPQYYDMLSERILDTGISVRKRVIKIFRDICLEQPDFPKIPEMCVRMIRRVNDEEGIKKLVNETFQQMWFTPHRETRDDAKKRLIQRVVNITDVVSACKDSSSEWLEQLLENLLKKELEERDQPVARACVQLVDCLVENVLTLEESGGDVTGGRAATNSRILACFSTLYLFCKVKPRLLVTHTTTIQPYLNIKCASASEIQVLHNVTRILELSVPLMEHPGESFLAQLEEDMMKLILKHGMIIVQSCVSCLGAVVNQVTHNYKLVRDCFQKFFGVLSKLMTEHKKDPKSSQLTGSKGTLLRSLFTVGLLCKNFDFDSENFGEKKVCDSNQTQVSIRDRVFDVLMYFMSHEDEDVRHKALTGMGFFCTRHYDYMLDMRLRNVYHDLLLDSDHHLQANSHDMVTWESNKQSLLRMKIQLLRNLQNYLLDEERKMMVADAEWQKTHEKEDLKEMGDIQSGMASTVIQVYLKQLLESFFHVQPQVRIASLGVITLILSQGLVHPVQCVPYLICMGSDCDTQIRIKADNQLQDIEKKYPGFIQMKALPGIKMSYRLQCMLQQAGEPVRAIRIDKENASCVNQFIYSLIRSNRNNRRALLGPLLNMFDETARTPLPELLYMADCLAFFPYQLQDEPLYIIHQVDILVSVSGSNVLQSFQEIFYPGSTTEEGKKKFDEDEDDDVDTLTERVPDDATGLIQLDQATQACALLLVLKQHLKDMYGFTDGKIHRYSPTDTSKTWDKPVNRRNNVRFNPVKVLEEIKRDPPSAELTARDKREYAEKYLDFKELMLSIDPDDDEEDEEGNKIQRGPRANPAPGATLGAAGNAFGHSAPVPPANGEGVNMKTEMVPPDQEDGDRAANMSSESLTIPTTTGDAQLQTTPKVIISTRGDRSPRSRHSSHYSIHSASSERKRSRTPGSSSRHKHHKSHKHKKKKKKKKRYSDSEEDEDDSDSDPDFTG